MARNRIAKSNINRTANRCYCLVDGVLTPMVYQKQAEDGAYYYDDLHITSPNRLDLQGSLRQETIVRQQTETTTTTVTKPTGVVTTTTSTTIKALYVWDYTFGVVHASNLVSSWSTSFGSAVWAQATANLKPLLGERKGGKVNGSALFFDGNRDGANGDYMIASAITLSGDFTIFIYITPQVGRYIRLLGKSSDANVYISLHEDASSNFDFGLGSGKTYSISTATSPMVMREGALITIQRSGTTLYYRKNGVEQGSATVATDDFVFDQLGRLGTSTATYGGSIHHLSIYDGYISTRLAYMETALMIESPKAYI